MRVGIDLDEVLFDTDRFKSRLKREFPDFEESYESSKSGGLYRFEEHAERMGVDPARVLELAGSSSDLVLDRVEKLESLDHELILVSKGREEFQRAKIQGTRLKQVFDEVHVFEEFELPKDEADIDFLIDDRESELEKVEVPGRRFDLESGSVEDLIRLIEEAEKQTVKTRVSNS